MVQATLSQIHEAISHNPEGKALCICDKALVGLTNTRLTPLASGGNACVQNGSCMDTCPCIVISVNISTKYFVVCGLCNKSSQKRLLPFDIRGHHGPHSKRQWHLAVETVEARDRKVSFEGTTCTNGSGTLSLVKSLLLCWKTTIPTIAMV